MEINFYLDDDVAEKFFKVKNMLNNRRMITGNEFAKEIVQNYIKSNYKNLEEE